MKKPQVGEVYYEVSFADPGLKIPRVEPMEFAGACLFPDDEEQGVVSYYFRRPATASEVEPATVTEYYCCTEQGLEAFCTLIEAAAKLCMVAAGVDLTKPPGSRGLNL